MVVSSRVCIIHASEIRSTHIRLLAIVGPLHARLLHPVRLQLLLAGCEDAIVTHVNAVLAAQIDPGSTLETPTFSSHSTHPLHHLVSPSLHLILNESLRYNQLISVVFLVVALWLL